MANIQSYLSGTAQTISNSAKYSTNNSNLISYKINNTHDFDNLTTDIYYSANNNLNFDDYALYVGQVQGDPQQGATGYMVENITTDIIQTEISGNLDTEKFTRPKSLYTLICNEIQRGVPNNMLTAGILQNIDYSKIILAVYCEDKNGNHVNIDTVDENTLVYINNIDVRCINDSYYTNKCSIYFIFDYNDIKLACNMCYKHPYSSPDRWYGGPITTYNGDLYAYYTVNRYYNLTNNSITKFPDISNNEYFYSWKNTNFDNVKIDEIRVNQSQYGSNYALSITPLIPIKNIIKLLNATGLRYCDSETFLNNFDNLKNLYYIGHMKNDGITDCNKRYRGDNELFDSDSLNKYYTSYNTLTPPPENVTPLPADIDDNLVNNELNNITIENKFLRYYLIDDIDQFRIAVDNKRDQNPLQYLVSLNMIPVFLIPYMLGVPTTDGIQMGNVPIAYNAVIVNNVRATFNVGNINVTPYYNNFMDYAPYTQAYLYIPYFELIQLDVNKCMNKNLSIEIGWDYETGDAISYIKSNGSLVTTKRANFYSSQIISADNHTRKMMTILGSIGTGIVGTAAGIGSGNLLTIAGSIGAAVTGYQQGLSMNSRSTVGSIGTATSFTMPKIPTLYMVRPRAKIPENYKSEKGYMSFKNGVLSNFHGFTSCLNPHIDIPTATDTEKNMIENLLQTGIILP